MSLLAKTRERARRLKRDVVAVYYAARDPRTPPMARALAVLVAGYALSPIDLIPDFIPVLGYLDDLILVPLGMWLVLRMLPPEVLAESREKARVALARPESLAAAAMVICLWVLGFVAIVYGWYLGFPGRGHGT